MVVNLTVLNLQVKLYHKFIYLGKNIVNVEFGTIYGYSHPLRL